MAGWLGRACVLGFGALVFTSCGNSDHAARPDAGAQAKTYPLFADMCRFLERCQPELLQVFQGGSLDACLSRAECSAPTTNWERSFADPAACANFIRDADCAAISLHWLPVTLPKPPNMGGLYFDTGGACDPPKPPLGTEHQGDVCLQSENACVSGFYCSASDPPRLVGTQYCGRCAPVGSEGSDCSDGTPCTGGTHCISGTCQIPGDVGAACGTDRECVTWQCENGTCSELPSFEKPILPVDEYLGQPCDAADSSDPCFDGPLTDCLDGLCTLRPDVGETCDPETSRCRAGSLCHDGTCVEVGCTLEIGDPCVSFCTTGVCDEDTALCVPAPTLGEPCTLFCEPPYHCDVAGVCSALRANGVGCRSSGDCTSGFCNRDYSPYCDPILGCSIPDCEADCGTCAEPPTRAACE